jgi:hypothetical protein
LVRRGKTVIEFTTAHVLGDPDYVVATIRDHLPAAAFPRISR